MVVRIRSSMLVALATCLCLSRLAAHAGNAVPLDPLVRGRAVVRVLDTSTLPAFLNAFNTAYAPQMVVASQQDAIANRPVYLLNLDLPPDFSDTQMHALEQDLGPTGSWGTHLSWGELLYQGQAPEAKTGSTFVDSVGDQSSFNDQYSKSKIALPAALNRASGAGTVVAVLDTGVDTSHPALAGHIAPGGFNFITNTANVADAGNGLNEDNDQLIDEGAGHGTFIAGLIVLTAPSSRLLPITVLDTEGRGDGWLFTKGLYYAIDRGVEVINLSLASTYDSKSVYHAIAEARSRGIVVVAAAGNYSVDDPREYPAMLDGPPGQQNFGVKVNDIVAFGVTALDDLDVKASFSNYNRNLFICAPGASAMMSPGDPDLNRSIISTLPGGHFGVWEGTSMSVPLVSGTVALVRSQHPEWSASESTWIAIRDLLANTAFDIYPMNPGYGGDTPQLGVGRLDAGAAVGGGPIAPELGDLNADGVVGIADLIALIGSWSQVHSSADLNGDGTVNIHDLLLLIQHWG